MTQKTSEPERPLRNHGGLQNIALSNGKRAKQDQMISLTDDTTALVSYTVDLYISSSVIQ